LSGFDMVVAMIGLFGLGEVLYILIKDEGFEHVEQEQGFPKVRLDVLLKNKVNLIRSTLAGLWVGFIPGVGESAACWFSYDLAKRSSKEKERFGKGAEEGIIAAETANNASSIGALIPALALGVPGSATAAIFIAALYMMNYRPGPTLMIEAPGILSRICVLFVLAALMMLVVGYVLTRFVIRFLTIPNTYLMPIVAVFCAIGSYGSTYTMFSLAMLLFFGLIGLFMKLYHYPIAPMVLGLLVGNTADTSLRRAMMQYGSEPLDLIMRPFGLAVIVVLVILTIISVKTSK
jgi:putative tricarboxylic transport membrane protein